MNTSIFGMWEEAETQRELRHGENTQTAHKKPAGWWIQTQDCDCVCVYVWIKKRALDQQSYS